MTFIRKINPITALTRALDATDRLMARIDKWSVRYDYQGHHWATT